MSKFYYAAEHRYGIEFCNDYDTLYRFTSSSARDAFVEDANWHEVKAYGGYRTESITRKVAVRHFADAFKLLGAAWIQAGSHELWCVSR